MATLSDLFRNISYDKPNHSNKMVIISILKYVIINELIFFYFQNTVSGENDNSKCAVKFTPNSSEKKWVDFVKTSPKVFIELYRCQPYVTINYQVDLSLQFMEYFESVSCEDVKGTEIVIENTASLFELILSVYKSIRTSLPALIQGNSLFVESILSKFGTVTSSELWSESSTINHCTMIVCDSGDIETASDILVNAFNENSLPWRIRNVYVQETIKQRFIESIAHKLRPFDESFRGNKDLITTTNRAIDMAHKMGLTIIRSNDDQDGFIPSVILGQNWNYFYEDPKLDSIEPFLILLNVYRTPKELISLAKPNLRGSVTLWSENISLAYEIVNHLDVGTVWINSYGVFNPSLPYTFSNPLNVFGSAMFNGNKSQLLVESQTPSIKVKIDRPIGLTNYSMARIVGATHYECLTETTDVYQSGEYLYRKVTIAGKVVWMKIAKIDMNESLFNKFKIVSFDFGTSFGN